VTTEASRSRLIHENEGPIAIQPDGAGRERFYRTGKQIIEACELDIGVELWFGELQGMVAEVRRIAKEHVGRIRSCYCSPIGSRVTIFFSPKSESFDFELADQLATLNTSLLHRFKVGNLELHQVPWAELSRFINLDEAWLIYGEQGESPVPVGAQ